MLQAGAVELPLIMPCMHATVPLPSQTTLFVLHAVAVLGGEAAFTGLSTDASTPGRPTLAETLTGVAGTLGVRCPRHGGAACEIAAAAAM